MPFPVSLENSTVQAAPPIHMRSQALHKFVSYYIVSYYIVPYYIIAAVRRRCR